MSPEVFVDVLRDALFLVILLVSAIILPSLFVVVAPPTMLPDPQKIQDAGFVFDYPNVEEAIIDLIK